jgi:hypothetical protein
MSAGKADMLERLSPVCRVLVHRRSCQAAASRTCTGKLSTSSAAMIAGLPVGTGMVQEPGAGQI